MRNRPHLPASCHLREQLILRLVDDIIQALDLKERHVREKHNPEDRVPQHLVDEDFGKDGCRIRSRDHAIELAIEPVRGGAVHKEAEAGEPEEASPVKRICLLDENLREDVANSEARERGESLHEQRLFVEKLLVSLPRLDQRIGGLVIVLWTIRSVRGVTTTAAAVAASSCCLLHLDRCTQHAEGCQGLLRAEWHVHCQCGRAMNNGSETSTKARGWREKRRGLTDKEQQGQHHGEVCGGGALYQ
mmetsp:Transcript_18530/g.39911  ORF Transcript_18530/g.39911 Transcript_18530/m.39911 type:complete len:246 (-) Transcript_18530:4-741(-)